MRLEDKYDGKRMRAPCHCPSRQRVWADEGRDASLDPEPGSVLGCAFPCHAGLVIQAPNLSVTPGSSGTFDVLLLNTNSSGGDSFNVAGDTIQLFLTGPLDVAFTDVTIGTTAAPYIYVTSGTGGGPLSFELSNTQFLASDSEFASPGFRTFNPGDMFGLLHVSYSVGASTPPGTETIGIDNTGITSLTGSLIPPNALSFTVENGSLTVASAVPEPSSMIMAATAVLIGLGTLCIRRWRSNRDRAPS